MPTLLAAKDALHTPATPLRKRMLFWLATRLGWLLILLLGHLTRLRFHGREHLERLRDSKRPFIYCIWHGKILMPIFAHRNENNCAMVSEHADGEMIAQTLHRLGYLTVRGSSTRGGTRAMIAMIRTLKGGGVGAIMPDGPKGPRHVFKPGALVIAQRAQAYLLPFTFASTRAWVLKSWDHFTIPKPFSKSVAYYGEPIAVPAVLTEEEFASIRKTVEQKMLDLEEEAEAFFRKGNREL
ncbi:MAG: lysophospholipid acyltransferase family protein [bacterium]